jgi:hypothetical protein
VDPAMRAGAGQAWGFCSSVSTNTVTDSRHPEHVVGYSTCLVHGSQGTRILRTEYHGTGVDFGIGIGAFHGNNPDLNAYAGRSDALQVNFDLGVGFSGCISKNGSTESQVVGPSVGPPGGSGGWSYTTEYDVG